jgi:Mrp family chromosome partitioning ATPase
VEGNLQSPTLHELFGLSVRRGLSEVLLEGGDVRLAVAKVAANLWLLPGGSRGADAYHCFSGEELRPRFRELLATFDYLVVDSAAANAHRDAAVLGPLVDGIVLVVAANGTRRETARRTVEHLQAAGSKVLGAVLADRTYPIPEVIYRKL